MAALPWNHWNVHFFIWLLFFFTFQYILFFLSVFSFLPCHRCGLCVPDFSLQSAQLRATRGLWLVSSTFGNVHEGFGVSKVKGDLIHTFKVSLNREKKLLQVKSAKNKKRGGINGWTRLKFFCGFTHRWGGETTKRSPATSSQIELLCSVLIFGPGLAFLLHLVGKRETSELV